MDSSVIFLVIIGLWAAYLVPHWLRRREQLSASRSVDRFSAAMRVLARRSETPVPDRRPVSRSYVLMPPRQEVRDVVVKRARPVDDGTPAPRPTAPRAASEPRTTTAAASTRPSRALPLALLGLLVAVPVLVVLAVVGVTPAWAPVVAVGLTAGVVVRLRAAAVRRRAARRPRVAAASRGRADAQVPAPADAVIAEAAAHESPAAAESVAVPGSWTPVPVPPPTYTLKDAAPVRRPAPLPEPVAPVVAPDPVVAPEVVGASARVDLDAVLERRRASGE